MPDALASQPADRWFVTNGVAVVGPLSFALLQHGVASGKLPQGSLVRHEAWHVWRGFEEVDGLDASSLRSTISELAQLSARLEQRASGPLSEPPPPPSREQLVSRLTPDSGQPALRTPAQKGGRALAVDPVGVLNHANTLSEALPLTLSTMTQAVLADVALLHRTREDLGGVVTMYTQGRGTEGLLGEKLRSEDPSLQAAREGRLVVVEPEPGELGLHIAGRLSRAAPGLVAMAMLPLVASGRLALFVELGRMSRAFTARELARAEDVLRALGERAVVQGWLE